MVAPRFVPVSVFAQLVLTDVGRAAKTLEDLRAALDSFLHPLAGGTQGLGWDFGQVVHLSDVARLVESVQGIGQVLRLQLSSGEVIYGDALPIPHDRLPTSGRHVLKAQLER